MADTYWNVTTPAGHFDLVQGAILAEDEVRSRDVMQHMHAMIDVLAGDDVAKITRAAAQALAELNAEETAIDTEGETVPEDTSGVMPEGVFEDSPGDEDGSAGAEGWAPPGMRWLDGVLVPIEVPDDEARAIVAEAPAVTGTEPIEQRHESLSRIADALEATAAIAVLALDMPEDVSERADAIMTRWLQAVQPR